MPTLCLDIGGSWIKEGIYDTNGTKLVSLDPVSSPSSRTDYYEKLNQIIQNVVDQIDGVAISTTGVTDGSTYLSSGSFPEMVGENITTYIQEYFHLPAYIFNDGRSALFGERWLGEFREVENGILMTLGTAIGGGLLLNGEPYAGTNHLAGEFSFLTGKEVKPLFPVAYSSTQFFDQARDILGDDSLNGEMVFRFIERGENDSLNQLFENYCERIGRLIFNLQMILDPQKVIIGGGISAQPLFISEVNRQYREIYKKKSEEVMGESHMTIVASQLNNDANLVGALYLYQQERNK